MRFIVDEGPDGTLPPDECLKAAQMLREAGVLGPGTVLRHE